MDDFFSKVKPFHNKHSIKEAVISLFLANKLVNPERFQKLIEKEFKGKFKKFDRVEQVQFQLQKKENISSVTTNTLKDNGFRFSDFDSHGQTIRVFQGLNDPTRTYLSFHSLDYSIWNDFFSDFKETLSSFSNNTEVFINSFSLQYTDVFNWDGTVDEFLTNNFFNTESEILPIAFFKSKFKRTFLLTIEEKIDGHFFFDRIEIKIEQKILPEISISHNVAHKFSDDRELKSLIISEDLEQLLSIAHNRNKDILGNILTFDIKKIINL